MELEDRTLFNAAPMVSPLVAHPTATDLHAASAPSTTTTTHSAGAKTADVVLIDSTLANSSLLEQSVQPGAKVIMYDGAKESAAQVLSDVAKWAQQSRTEISSLSILSHGVGGEFELGDQWVSTATISETAKAWRELNPFLAPGASIDIYGCDVAEAGSTGQALLDDLAGLTGAQIFASTHVVGAGGGWNLDAASAGAQEELAEGLATPFNEQLLESYQGALGTIALDSTTTAGSNGNVGSLTFSHTVGSGSNGILVVSIAASDYGIPVDVVSVTYDGQALTQLQSYNNGTNDVDVWYLLNPTAGTSNVVIQDGSRDSFAASATSYFGVDQTTPFTASVTTTGNSTTPSATVASSTGETIIDAVAAYNNIGTLSPTSGQTEISVQRSGSQSDSQFVATSWINANASSTTMSWSGSGSAAEWDMVAAAMNPVAAPVAPTFSAPANSSLNENSSVTFSTLGGNSISINDPDAGSNTVQLSLSSTHGTLDLSSTSGLTFTSGSDGARSMTIRGTLSDINSALDGLTYTPNTNYAGRDSLKLTYNDLGATGGSPRTANDTVALTVVSSTPVNMVPPAQDTNANTGLTFSAANGNQISVADGAVSSLQETLTAANGTLTLNGTSGLTFTSGTGTNDSTMTFSGSIADINNALNGMVFQPTNNFYGSANLQITSTDNVSSGGPYSASDSVAITVDAGLQPTVILPTAQSTSENTSLVFSSTRGNQISIDDDNPGTPSVTLTVSNGTLTLGQTTNLTFTTGTGTGDATMTFSGSENDLIAALNGLTYTPTAGFFGSDSVQVTINDPSALPASDSGSVAVTVNQVNQPPVNTVPGPQSVNDNQNLVFSSAGGNQITVSDADSDGNPEQVTLSVTQGTLKLGGTSGLTFTAGADGSATMTVQGTLANINAALNGLAYTPPTTLNNNSSDTLTLVSDDLGNTGLGGALTATSSIALTLNHVDIAPVNTIPGLQSVNDNATLVFGSASGNAISIFDRDSNGNSEQLTLSVAQGTLTLCGTSGLSFTAGANGSASMTVEGTLANLNAALNGLTYTPPTTLNSNSSDTLTVVSNDLGHTGLGGPQTATNTVSITLNHVNLAPVNSVPGPQSVDDNTTLVFSSAGGNAISISDRDAAGSPEQITLSVTQGTLMLGGTSGLSFTAGANGSSSMTVEGTLANLNAALNGLAYTPPTTLTNNSSDTLTLVTNDLGTTSLGGAQTATSSVAIALTHVNVAPVLNVPGTQSVGENASLVFSSSGGNAITLSDRDANGNPEQITLTASGGTISLSGTAGLTFSSGTGTGTGNATMTFTGTIANINQALAGLAFTPTANTSGAATIQITASDLGNTGIGGPQTAASTINVGVVPSVPTVTVPPAQQSSTQGQIFSVATGNPILVGLQGGSNGLVQVVLVASGGTISLPGTSGVTFAPGSGSAGTSIVFSGSVSSVNAALNGLTFLPSTLNGSLQISVANPTANIITPASSVIAVTQVPLVAMGPSGTASLTIRNLTQATNLHANLNLQSVGLPSATVVLGQSAGRHRLLNNVQLVGIAQPNRKLFLVEEAEFHIVGAALGNQPRKIGQATVRDHHRFQDASLSWQEIESLMKGIQMNISSHALEVGAAAGVGAMISAGYVVWCLRAGTLVASALSALPAWRSFDPLPVLEFWERRQTATGGKKNGNADDSTSEDERQLHTVLS